MELAKMFRCWLYADVTKNILNKTNNKIFINEHDKTYENELQTSFIII